MVTLEEARRIGVRACIHRLGENFVLEHRESATSVYSVNPDEAGEVFCYVGVDDAPQRLEKTDTLVLDNFSKFPYYASCNVSLMDGKSKFLDCFVPKMAN